MHSRLALPDLRKLPPIRFGVYQVSLPVRVRAFTVYRLDFTRVTHRGNAAYATLKSARSTALRRCKLREYWYRNGNLI